MANPPANQTIKVTLELGASTLKSMAAAFGAPGGGGAGGGAGGGTPFYGVPPSGRPPAPPPASPEQLQTTWANTPEAQQWYRSQSTVSASPFPLAPGPLPQHLGVPPPPQAGQRFRWLNRLAQSPFHMNLPFGQQIQALGGLGVAGMAGNAVGGQMGGLAGMAGFALGGPIGAAAATGPFIVFQGMLKALNLIADNSQIMKSYLSSLQKIFSAAIDILLMPFTPVLNILLMMALKLYTWLTNNKSVTNWAQNTSQTLQDILKGNWSAVGKEMGQAFLQTVGNLSRLFTNIPGIGGAARIVQPITNFLQHPSLSGIKDLPMQVIQSVSPDIAKAIQHPSKDTIARALASSWQDILGIPKSWEHIFTGGGGQKKPPTQTPSGGPISPAPTPTGAPQSLVPQITYSPNTTINVAVTAPSGADPNQWGRAAGRAAASQLPDSGRALGPRYAGAAYAG